MNPHLVRVPGLGTLTVGGLAGGDLEVLGGQAHGALYGELLGARTVNELVADLLERRDLARRQGDADLVGFLAADVSTRKSWLGGAGGCVAGDDVPAARRNPFRASGTTW